MLCPKKSYFMSGKLEPANSPYAMAKQLLFGNAIKLIYHDNACLQICMDLTIIFPKDSHALIKNA